jgi:uncharacterized membrane protein
MIPTYRISKSIIICTFVLLCLVPGAKTAHAQDNVVHAVEFYSPTCGHCKIVKDEMIIPMRAQYGTSLFILEIDVSTQAGNDIYQAAKSSHPRMAEEAAVPALVVGNTVLIGSIEIPEQFPDIVSEGLEASGIDWPEIPGLQEYIEEYGESGTSRNSIADIFNQDPFGNFLSVLVLSGMLFASIRVWLGFSRTDMGETAWPDWFFPALIAIGLIAASYLSYVELTQSEAFCGPVGDCNAVQHSKYAKLFGILPIAVLGLAGYISILIVWLLKNFGPKKWHKSASLTLVCLTGFGTLFSIYLTFLEPFVIGATCAWCLTSAVAMTMLLWISAAAYIDIKRPKRLKKRKKHRKKRRHRH